MLDEMHEELASMDEQSNAHLKEISWLRDLMGKLEATVQEQRETQSDLESKLHDSMKTIFELREKLSATQQEVEQKDALNLSLNDSLGELLLSPGASKRKQMELQAELDALAEAYREHVSDHLEDVALLRKENYELKVQLQYLEQERQARKMSV
eukprot:PhF_6_TR4962/c0_g1_i2/m.7032